LSPDPFFFMLILGLDFETTGLDIPNIGVTEIGMVLWETSLNAPVRMIGMLVDPGSYAKWEPGVEKINNLTPAIVSKYGEADERALKYVLSWYGSADIACAHNGNNFDKPLLEKWASRYGLDAQKEKLWIDTRADIERPPRDSHRLGYMAADHGFLNPFPHRAMFDVMTMFTILMAPDVAKAPPKYDLNQIQEIAKSPLRIVKAIVSFDQKELAKTRGYHPIYENGKFVRWELEVKEFYLDKEREAARLAGFEIEVIR
jgi:DNA polymerase III subunit epsilon